MMTNPMSIKFTDLEIPTRSLTRRADRGPMNTSWSRTQFAIPNGYEAPRKVEEWLAENCPGLWQSYSYRSPKTREDDHIMVVRFEDKNDALMFKLRGGHQAWQV